MLQGIHKYSFIWIIIHLWVVSTLPLHTHPEPTSVDHCEHSTKQDHHDHESTDDCQLCFNLHTPFALANIQFIHLDIAEIYLYNEKQSDQPLICYNKYIHQSANKDPPFLVIS